MRTILLTGGVAVALGAGLATYFFLGRATPKAFASGDDAFRYVYSLSAHPRCRNCHGIRLEGRHVPTVGEGMQPHPMRIESRLTSLGMNCTGCHQGENFDRLGMPPGAANDIMPELHWQMPPPFMIFTPETGARGLCEAFLDPQRNALKPGIRGGKDDLALLRKSFLHHVKHDPLLLWSFAPGPGRIPAPGSPELLAAAVDEWFDWLESGHDCSEL